MARIVITTFGSLGDLYPYVAIARALRARGHDAIMATGACYRRKIEALGLGFHAVRPDSVWVNDPKVMARITHPRWGLVRVRELVLPWLRESYEDLRAATAGADLLVANQASYAARLVAEKANLTWASAMHVPVMFFSAHRPPLIPGFPGLTRGLRPLGPWFWGPLGSSMKYLTRFLARPWYRFRAELKLPPAGDLNPLTDGQAPLLHLALFSALLADKQPDWPTQTVVTGFPWHDQAGQAGLPPELERFLRDGPPPIVFTLGTAVAAAAGSFFHTSVEAARSLGHRAVLMVMHPRNRPKSLPPGVAVCEYAPFSELFPRAAAIVHQGGIGSTGLAMRSGRPMLVVPCAWDQPDNADRVTRLGIARTLPRPRYTAARAAAELRPLLENSAYAAKAHEIAQVVGAEDGACQAARELEKLL
jgi:UDP:flavonoid glycosyltransferase YjiC (YdhE family)